MLIQFKLNGRTVAEEAEPNETLLDFLRERLNLTSVKKGCDEGDCGACTILLNEKPVRSCLLLAVQMREGEEVITVEGLAKQGELSEIQEAFLEKYGFQCGFCTPGMILMTKALLDENPRPTIAEIKDQFEGNLCRCTGYAQIIDSVLRAAELRASRR
ncbi:MAG: (2Fe-2S)-binding protein [Deltaproteobacteria bacterium]|nr:(2Fe-2S)-binding protein [Deltaproteobacteria bacterium]